MDDSQEPRLIIFVSDFQLEFSVPVETVVRQLQEIVQYVESRGHLITFAFLPYVPEYSLDPCAKPSFFPNPDHTNYLVTINK